MIQKITAVMGLSFMLLVGAGCALIHPTDPYPAVGPGRQNLPGLQLVSQNDDDHLKKEKLAGNPSLTLSEAIQIALENNPQVAVARHEIDMASARYDQAFARALPSLSAIGEYTHDMDDQRLIAPHYNGDPGVFGDDIYSADIVLSQPLFAGGRLVKEISATKLLTRAATHRLSRTKKELEFNVTSTFYAILAQREVIDSFAFSEKTLQEHLVQVNNLIAQKKAARVDRLRTEVRIADIVAQLTRAENVLSVQTRVLVNLMGVADTQGPLDIKGSLAAKTFEPPDLAVDIQSAFQHRSDYLAARDGLEATANEVDAARAEHWPSIFLQGSYGMRWADNPTDYPTGTDKSEDIGRVGVLVNVPIFESGRISAKVREQRAALEVAQEKLRAFELGIRLDVETAGLNIETAQKRMNTTEKAVDQAKETFRIERLKYEQGKGAIIDVLDAQSALLSSQTTYYQTLAEFHTAVAQLRLATGEIK